MFRTSILSVSFLVAACAAPSSPGVPIDDAVLRALATLERGEHDAAAALDSGRHVAFIFWQPWCRRCSGETPEFVVAQRELGDRLSVFGVVSGPDDHVDLAAMRSKIETLGLDYPQVRDRTLELTRLFGVAHIPTVVVIAPDRSVRFRGERAPTDWSALLAR